MIQSAFIKQNHKELEIVSLEAMCMNHYWYVIYLSFLFSKEYIVTSWVHVYRRNNFLCISIKTFLIIILAAHLHVRVELSLLNYKAWAFIRRKFTSSFCSYFEYYYWNFWLKIIKIWKSLLCIHSFIVIELVKWEHVKKSTMHSAKYQTIPWTNIS